MNLDDKVCYCYHVSLRKLINFARREQPPKASQMSSCLGAGTGCGWCIPILKKIHASALAETPPGPATGTEALVPDLPDSAAAYALGRQHYLRSEDKNQF